MRIYMFVSQGDNKIVAFTSDETGHNLPRDHGPWKLSNSGSAVAVGNSAGPLAEIVRKFGFYVTAEQSIH